MQSEKVGVGRQFEIWGIVIPENQHKQTKKQKQNREKKKRNGEESEEKTQHPTEEKHTTTGAVET